MMNFYTATISVVISWNICYELNYRLVLYVSTTNYVIYIKNNDHQLKFNIGKT